MEVGSNETLRNIATTLLIAIAYTVTGKLGLLSVMEAAGGGNVTLVWPPTGVAFAAVLMLGYRAWPGLAIGALAINFLNGAPLVFTVATAIGNPLPAILAIYLLRHFGKGSLHLDHLKGVLWFVTVPCFATTTLSATFGSLSLLASGVIPTEALSSVWVKWWIGDSMGVLLVAPLLLTLQDWKRTSWTKERAVEGVSFVFVLLIGCLATLTDFLGASHGSILTADQLYFYLLFPVAVWGSTRFGQKGAALVVSLALVFSIVGALIGHGPFILDSLTATLLHMHAFLAALAFVSFFLAAVSEERLRVTEELKESETMFRNLFEYANDSIFIVEPHTRQIIDANANAAKRLGYKRAELLSFNLREIEDPEFAGLDPEFLNALKNEGCATFEHFQRHKDGTLIPVEISAQIIDRGPKKVIQAIVRDITKGKAAESQLRKLSLAVEQSPNMIFITDLDGKIEYVNGKFTEITGYTKDEAIGTNPSILKSGTTSPELYQNFWSTIKSGNEWRGEIEDKRKDGSLYWAAMSVTPVKNLVGEVTHFVAVHEDISDRKVAEQRILDAHREAETANKAKSELLANMSHELRTPLNAIIGFSDTLLSEILGPLSTDKQREYVNDIHHSGQHLLELINDILDMSAIEAGKVELSQDLVEIPDILDSSFRLVGPRAKLGEVSLSSEFEPDLPLLRVDERRTKQILLNLLSNAVKFTEPGGSVVAKAKLTQNGEMEITVSDNGIGMDADEVKKALTRFGQADSGLDRKHEGTGLGLPLTRKLLELHDGKLRIESKKNKGTVATAVFPSYRLEARAVSNSGAAE